MEVKDIMLLRQFVKSKPYNFTTFNLDHVFKEYSSMAISSMQDFSKVSQEFSTILKCLEDCFVFNSEADKLDLEMEAAKYPLYLKNMFEPKFALKDDKYTFTIKELAPSKEQTRVLEVGSGQVPHSSLVLAQDIKHVSSLDKFLLSESCLKKLGVHAIEGTFDKDTEVQDYDFVIGQRPCSAIESMVINASKENKPYFIELCNCSLNEIAKRDGVYRNWQQILPEYDSQVKFVENYAFNVDATESQISNLLYLSSMKTIKMRQEQAPQTNEALEKFYEEKIVDFNSLPSETIAQMQSMAATQEQ